MSKPLIFEIFVACSIFLTGCLKEDIADTKAQAIQTMTSAQGACDAISLVMTASVAPTINDLRLTSLRLRNKTLPALEDSLRQSTNIALVANETIEVMKSTANAEIQIVSQFSNLSSQIQANVSQLNKHDEEAHIAIESFWGKFKLYIYAIGILLFGVMLHWCVSMWRRERMAKRQRRDGLLW